ncbi:MAG: LL-diaminopimelate aminotransferase [Planctomycetota bacterium]
MAHINDHYLNLSAGYLFPEIARRVGEFTAAHPDAAIIKMGIGDVTEPLPAAAVEAMHKALDEQTVRETFQGYGPGTGYDFLRHAITDNCYAHCPIDADEIVISDGSKCDSANILDIFGPSKVAVCDPVYPVYVDTNVMAGNASKAGDDGRYGGLVYLPATAENGFQPPMPPEPVDLVYLCFPNNPTGTVADRATLQAWVDWCRANDAVLLFDAAYEAFIQTPGIPHSIYELDGATECAIEFRSFSKTAGFTGVRAAWTVVPKTLTAKSKSGDDVSLHGLWSRRQSTKFNGISYIVSRGCEAVFSDAGKQQVAELVGHYMANAELLRSALTEQGMTVYGGVDAPYVWVRCPEGETSWQTFDRLLHEHHLVCTPGSGFGQAGEGYVRLSAFNSRANVEEAVHRLG